MLIVNRQFCILINLDYIELSFKLKIRLWEPRKNL